MYQLTISMVICIKHDEDILNHWYQDEGVEDEGEDTEEVITVLDAIREGAGYRIEWRRPNIPIDDANALKRKLQQP